MVDQPQGPAGPSKSASSYRPVDSLLRPLSSSEVSVAHSLIRSVGWPVGLPYVAALQASPCVHYHLLVAPSDGFEGTDIEAGAVAGSLQLSRQGNTTGVGLVILDQRLRGKGWGAALFDWGVRKARQLDQRDGISSSLLLTATPAGAAVYERQGFVKTGQTRELSLLLDPNRRRPAPVSLPSGHRIVPIDLSKPADGVETNLWRQAVSLADKATSSSRAAILDTVLRSLVVPPSAEQASSPVPILAPFALGILNDGTQSIVGWIGCFPMHRTQNLGPLVCPSLLHAKALVLAAIDEVERRARATTVSHSECASVSIEVDGRKGADDGDELGAWLMHEGGMEQKVRLEIMESPPRERCIEEGSIRQWATLDPSSC